MADEEDDAMVPCELCDTMVRFRDFSVHLHECEAEMQMRRQQQQQPVMFVIDGGAAGGADRLRRMLNAAPAARQVPPPSRWLRRAAAPRHAMEDDEREEEEGGRPGEDDDEDEEEDDEEDEEDEEDDYATAGANRSAAAWRIIGSFIGSAFSPASAAGAYEMDSAISEMIGRVERGIEDVSAVVAPVDAGAIDPADGDKCPVCQDALSDICGEGVAVVKTARCRHSFCEPCIRTWLSRNKTCPVCMCDLSPGEDTQLP